MRFARRRADPAQAGGVWYEYLVLITSMALTIFVAKLGADTIVGWVFGPEMSGGLSTALHITLYFALMIPAFFAAVFTVTSCAGGVWWLAERFRRSRPPE